MGGFGNGKNVYETNHLVLVGLEFFSGGNTRKLESIAETTGLTYPDYVRQGQVGDNVLPVHPHHKMW